MRRTALRGHALRGEGCAWVLIEDYNGDGLARWVSNPSGDRFLGVARCECGAISDVLTTTNGRRRWHAAHKDAIRSAAGLRSNG